MHNFMSRYPGYPGYYPQMGYHNYFYPDMAGVGGVPMLPPYYPYHFRYPPHHRKNSDKSEQSPRPNPYQSEAAKLTKENSSLLEKIKKETMEVCNLKKRVFDIETVSLCFSSCFTFKWQIQSNLTKAIVEDSKEDSVLEEEASSAKESQVSTKPRRKNRRLACEIDKCFKVADDFSPFRYLLGFLSQCPYQDCVKSYGSEVSLNFHIKKKHGGGNKSDRVRVAVSPPFFKIS